MMKVGFGDLELATVGMREDADRICDLLLYPSTYISAFLKYRRQNLHFNLHFIQTP